MAAAEGEGKKAAVMSALGFCSWSSGETLACRDGAVGSGEGEDEEEDMVVPEAGAGGAQGGRRG